MYFVRSSSSWSSVHLEPGTIPPDFYWVIAANYRALVAGGEPHPVKALAAQHHVTISAASRWLKEARRRGLVGDGNGE
jgi:hypothetical protein